MMTLICIWIIVVLYVSIATYMCQTKDEDNYYDNNPYY